ncbi:NUDIX hydrolase [Frankia sp. CcI49]|nr:NUDIX hydrolase [Frankia sp. CcI49]
MTAGSRQADDSSPSVSASRAPGLTASVPYQPVASSAEIEGRAPATRPSRIPTAGARNAAGDAAPSMDAAPSTEAVPSIEVVPSAEVVAPAESVDWFVAGENENVGPPMARPRAAAGALFFDEEGRVLLVEPSYKPGWDIPGGFIEPGESPYAACVREVEEEIGIVPPIGSLLVVDWASDEHTGDMLLFVFDGGLLPSDWRERIRLDMNEIINCAFTPLSDVGEKLPVLHARRVRAAAGLRAGHGGAGYLEHGYLTPAAPAVSSAPAGAAQRTEATD